jgi:putative transposase
MGELRLLPQAEFIMRRSKFTESQIIGILQQADAGMALPDLCRQSGISEGTFYRWRAKYGGMDASEAKRLRELEEENRKLKRLVADLSLDCVALKDALSGKYNRP